MCFKTDWRNISQTRGMKRTKLHSAAHKNKSSHTHHVWPFSSDAKINHLFALSGSPTYSHDAGSLCWGVSWHSNGIDGGRRQGSVGVCGPHKAQQSLECCLQFYVVVQYNPEQDGFWPWITQAKEIIYFHPYCGSAHCCLFCLSV